MLLPDDKGAGPLWTFHSIAVTWTQVQIQDSGQGSPETTQKDLGQENLEYNCCKRIIRPLTGRSRRDAEHKHKWNPMLQMAVFTPYANNINVILHKFACSYPVWIGQSISLCEVHSEKKAGTGSNCGKKMSHIFCCGVRKKENPQGHISCCGVGKISIGSCGLLWSAKKKKIHCATWAAEECEKYPLGHIGCCGVGKNI